MKVDTIDIVIGTVYIELNLCVHPIFYIDS